MYIYNQTTQNHKPHTPQPYKNTMMVVTKTSIGSNLMNSRACEVDLFPTLKKSQQYSNLKWVLKPSGQTSNENAKNVENHGKPVSRFTPLRTFQLNPTRYLYLYRLCRQNNLLPGTMSRPWVRIFKLLLLLLQVF